MKYCKNCGEELQDDAIVCKRCGKTVGEQPAAEQPVAEQPAAEQAPETTVAVQQDQPIEEKKKNGLGIAGFIISLISLVFSWVPIFAFIMVSTGFILSLVGIIIGKKKNQKTNLAIGGLIVSLIALLFAVIIYIVLGSILLRVFGAVFDSFFGAVALAI